MESRTLLSQRRGVQRQALSDEQVIHGGRQNHVQRSLASGPERGETSRRQAHPDHAARYFKEATEDMKEDGVQLIVPGEIHKQYPPNSDMRLLKVEQFVDLVRQRLA